MSNDPSEQASDRSAGDPAADVEELLADLGDLKADADAAIHDEVRDVSELLAAAHARGLIESGIRRLRPGDAAEAFVGSVIFASPLLVEDGVFDIAAYLFGFTVAGIPVFLIANTAFVLLMTYALLEWTGQDMQETHLLLGRLPGRVVMILVVSFVVAALLMTVWGRVGGWTAPIEALARINVLWTVGSIGAALGDILSESEAESVTISDRRSESPDVEASVSEAASLANLSDTELMVAIHEEFATLASAVDSETRPEVNRIRERATEATLDAALDDQIRKYTGRDIAEGFVGSVVFSIPFLVEDGVFDVAEYFLSFRIAQFPVFFLLNGGFILLMIAALVYWAGPQDVKVTRPIVGFIPRRLLGIAFVSFLTAAALMTVWGRVGNWEDPVIAVARISVVWTVASFGASLGDILPGESSGDDINDDLTDLGDRIRDFDEVPRRGAD